MVPYLPEVTPMISNSGEQSRPYKLVHQLLCISNINFERQSYIGLVEMHIIAQRADLRQMKLNCKQLRIFKITMNDFYPCTFTYNDPSLEICQEECKQRNIDSFSSCHFTCISSADPEKNNGEIIVQIPYQLNGQVQEGKVIRVNIEFGAENPLGGVHFAVPRAISDPEYNVSATHLFTYGHENSSRLWFPSIDSYCEACTWKLEFTVDVSMVAVSCGELIETVYTHDKKRKTYHYQLSIPTCAPAIGLAVGPFEVMVDPNMHEVTHFALPHLQSLLKDTCAFLHETFEFYEELLSTRYPYSCYKQVFVDEAYQYCQSYASFSIFDVNLLHSKHIIDQLYKTRKVLTTGIAQQFFGTFITMHSYADAWLTRGISAWMSSQYKRKAFGNNEYRYYVYENLNEVVAYEQKHGGLILDPSRSTDNSLNNLHFSPRYLHTVSPIYDEIHRKKSHLIIRMLEDRIGRELMLQVFNKLLSLAVNASQQKITTSTLNVWNNMHLSTNSFTKAIFTVTGKDIADFLSQWVYMGGHPKFHGSFVFNRKRNIVELEIKQLETSALGVRKYMGPITVWIQELDGTFKHNLQVEENTTKHDITCHSKSRRNKKKKIPLCTGEEIDMDLSSMDADSPVLWIRIDPDMQLLRQVVFEQPDINWQYQLRYERDVTAQAEAIEQLKKYPTPQTRKALTDIIENEQCYYKIRCLAAHALTHVANEMSSSGPPPMISIFRKLFGSYSCSNIPKLNNFSNFQAYFLQKTLPVAIAGLRTAHKICPPEVFRFILDLFKYNDNTKNKFSDNYYRAALVEALASTVTPCVTNVLARTSAQSMSDVLPQETKMMLEEIVRYFNLDKLLPCYKHTVTVACLKAIRHLQKMGHLPSNSAFYREYAQYGVFIDLRIQAIECLIDITKAEQRKEDLDYLLMIIESDPVPRVRFQAIRMMIENPIITRKDPSNLLNTEEFVDRLWRLMNNCLSYDSKLRCAVVDLYHTFYGRNRPSCLPKPEFSMVFNLKEKKAVLNTTTLSDRKSPNISSPANKRERSESAERLEAFAFLANLPKSGLDDHPTKIRKISGNSSHDDEESIKDQPIENLDKAPLSDVFTRPQSPSSAKLSPILPVTAVPMEQESLPSSSNSNLTGELVPTSSGIGDIGPSYSVKPAVTESVETEKESERKKEKDIDSATFSHSDTKKHKKKKKKHKLHKHEHKEHKHKQKHKHKDKDKDRDREKHKERKDDDPGQSLSVN